MNSEPPPQSTTQQSLTLEPNDARRLAKLCGHLDSHLQQIERRLGIEVRNRGNQFSLTGPAQHTKIGRQILQALYAETDGGKDLSADEVQSAIDPFIAEMKTRLPVTVMRRQRDLPEGIHTYLRENNGQNDIIVGAVDGGRVYLVAENIENNNEAIRALFHEIMGHFGIRAVLGDQANKVLDSIYIAKRSEVNPIAIEYGFNLKSAEGRRAAADEWLAREAETNPESTWIDRVIALIRKWIRKVNPNLTFSDAEIRALLAKSRHYVKTADLR